LRHGCLNGALTRRETWGVWGGEILDHGTVIARKRPRGRPPRADRSRADLGRGA
jgi:WhiB family redox-sensing transcriptional regulator